MINDLRQPFFIDYFGPQEHVIVFILIIKQPLRQQPSQKNINLIINILPSKHAMLVFLIRDKPPCISPLSLLIRDDQFTFMIIIF